MAILLGALMALFLLLAIALLGAAFRNPTWLVFAGLALLLLYWFGGE